MSVVIPISISMDFYTEAAIQRVFEVLADVPRSVGHFPNVQRLVDLGANTYRWEMEKMGTQRYHFQVQYAAQYKANEAEKCVRWSPISEGNGTFSGCWELRTEGKRTHVHFSNEGQLELPLPRLTKKIVQPFVRNKFHELFGVYIENLERTFTELSR